MILNVYLFDQEKLERLYELDRMLQEQSFKVTSLQEDKVSCCCCCYCKGRRCHGYSQHPKINIQCLFSYLFWCLLNTLKPLYKLFVMNMNNRWHSNKTCHLVHFWPQTYSTRTIDGKLFFDRYDLTLFFKVHSKLVRYVERFIKFNN